MEAIRMWDSSSQENHPHVEFILTGEPSACMNMTGVESALSTQHIRSGYKLPVYHMLPIIAGVNLKIRQNTDE